MKKTFTTAISALAIYAFVLVSCSKEQNAQFTNVNDEQVESIAREGNALTATTCAASIPDSLQVPEGNRLSFQVYAKGVQIYQVKQSATDPNSYSWVNIAPSANLYLKPDFTNQVGTHFGGPSWQFSKGVYKDEKVVAAKVYGVTVDPTAVAWLLLKTNDVLSSANNKITYIQRVCTAGGLPPTTGANEANLGKLDSIPYTTTYNFYELR